MIIPAGARRDSASLDIWDWRPYWRAADAGLGRIERVWRAPKSPADARSVAAAGPGTRGRLEALSLGPVSRAGLSLFHATRLNKLLSTRPTRHATAWNRTTCTAL